MLCANKPARPPKSSLVVTGICAAPAFASGSQTSPADSALALARFLHVPLSVSNVANEIPAYGMIPTSVGVRPPYKPRMPSCRSMLDTTLIPGTAPVCDADAPTFIAGLTKPPPPGVDKATVPLAAYLARMRSKGYVSVVAVAPAADPAMNRIAIRLPPPSSPPPSPALSPKIVSHARFATASYRG